MAPIHLDTKISAVDAGPSSRLGLQKQMSLPDANSKELFSKKEPLYQNAKNFTYGTVPPSPPSSRHAFQHHNQHGGAIPKIQYIPNIPVTDHQVQHQQPKRKDTPKLSNIPNVKDTKHGSPPKVVSGKAAGGGGGPTKKKRGAADPGGSPPPLPPPPASEPVLPPTPPVRRESSRLAMVGPLNATSVQSHTAHIALNGLPPSPGKDKPLHFSSEHSAFTPVTPQGSPQRKPRKSDENSLNQKAAPGTPAGGGVKAKHPEMAPGVAASKIPKLNRSPATPSSVKSDSRLVKQKSGQGQGHGHSQGYSKQLQEQARRKQQQQQQQQQHVENSPRGKVPPHTRPPVAKPPTEPSTSESETDYNPGGTGKRGHKNRPPAPPFQVKRRQRFNPPPRLSRSLDYIPSDLEDPGSSLSSRAESPLAAKFPVLDPEAFMPISSLVKQLADNISISSLGSGMSSEMSRSDSNLNYDSGSGAYESEYDNYRPGMASDEDYFIPEPISDVDIDMFDDINIDNVTISDTYSLDMPLAFMSGPTKKITDV